VTLEYARYEGGSNGVGQVRSGQDGREELFGKYVLPEIEVLLRVARSLTSQGADAEDLVQETLLRAYRAIDRFDGRHPRAWLLTILRNTLMNEARRRRPEPTDDLGNRASASLDVGPEDVVVGSQFDAAVEAAYRGLPERFRRVVELVDLDGLSYQEASVSLGVPVGTVMSRLHRGRRRIRQQLVVAGLGSGGRVA
jgi:RNA polymerase sigma-70 factor (ECF subfamily)